MATSKGDLFAEFFQVQESIDVVVEAITPAQLPDDSDALERDIPPLFRLANEVNTLEQSALRPLRLLGETASELAQYLSLQSRKIDLILSHILMQENADHPSERAHSYGGSGFTLWRESALERGQPLRCKLFLEHEAAAIYCYGEVIDISSSAQGFVHQILFTLVREQDRELLVRASLHAQTRQLKKRNQQQH
ncbi:PilZ domain-containing protein [Pseudoalteromonas sp. BDTF-M6]|uniref:PilZ domain-containing protein n=1 Tax=Pseudoalteromonas sp. BDTF-M6 TaxID=2796132 RepID=UPI001BAE97E9|nr:PilZ domain-containing protein [Pseudoalteromonas sp. BDTF-M6]MBS3796894.1 PilZ domain-containing protein [Pseudoalteromonas sp. BDTF-M6]